MGDNIDNINNINSIGDLVLRTDIIDPYKLNYITNAKKIRQKLSNDIDSNNFKTTFSHIIKSGNNLQFDIGDNKVDMYTKLGSYNKKIYREIQKVNKEINQHIGPEKIQSSQKTYDTLHKHLDKSIKHSNKQNKRLKKKKK